MSTKHPHLVLEIYVWLDPFRNIKPGERRLKQVEAVLSSRGYPFNIAVPSRITHASETRSVEGFARDRLKFGYDRWVYWHFHDVNGQELIAEEVSHNLSVPRFEFCV